jgi:hypothetical protein
MNRSRKLLTTALAATMLVGAVAVSTPASAWDRSGWGADWVSGWRVGFGPGWGYGGWMLGAGVASGLALAAAASYPYGYGYSAPVDGYYELSYPAYYGSRPYRSCHGHRRCRHW